MNSKLTAFDLTALLSVYFFWGTTYLAMKFAVAVFPSYMMLAIRFGVAGGLMYIILRMRGVPAPTLRQWRGSLITGGVMLFCSTGSVSLAETMVQSNIAAVVVAMVPLWMAFFQWAVFRQGRPGIWVIIGIALGTVGVIALMIAPSEGGVISGSPMGYALLVFASAMWALGSLISREIDVPKSPLMSISSQMLGGALFCVTFSALIGDFSTFDLSAVTMKAAGAVMYLIVFGSFVGYGSYIWLLRNTTPMLAATYAYVNPIVAIFMGWALAGESLTVREAIATVVILAAVVCIIWDTARGSHKSDKKAAELAK